MSEDKVPEWWHEVIDVEISSKTDAKRIVKLCHAGELQETWDARWHTYKTPEGTRIRRADFNRAMDVLLGVEKPDPGRKGFHDWDTIDRLIDEVAENMGQRVIRAEVCRQVSERHPTIQPTSSALRKRVSDRMKATGR